MTAPRFLSKDQFKEHVASLPPWDQTKDDDPNWVRPLEEFTGKPPVQNDAIMEHAKKQVRDGAPLMRVPVRDVQRTQTTLNLDAVYHYVDKPHELYDQDGWLGTDHPVVVRHPEHGFVVADGNSRFTAAQLRGEPFLKAHVVQGVTKPHHIQALKEYEEAHVRTVEAHGQRMDAIRHAYGPVMLGPKAHPEAKAAFQRSAKTMQDALAVHEHTLQAKLAR